MADAIYNKEKARKAAHQVNMPGLVPRCRRSIVARDDPPGALERSSSRPCLGFGSPRLGISGQGHAQAADGGYDRAWPRYGSGFCSLSGAKHNRSTQSFHPKQRSSYIPLFGRGCAPKATLRKGVAWCSVPVRGVCLRTGTC